MKRQYYGLVLGLLLLTAWLRLWQLPTIPPGLWFDESYNGMDVVMMGKTHSWPIFLPGNNGREALFHHILWLFTAVLGQSAYTLRLVPALLSLITVAFMYRWSLALFRHEPYAPWLALLSMTGFVTSLWFLIMSRTAYRANLLPFFVLFTHYFFWRGWQTNHLRYYLIAGLGLGLAQYTYFSARLLPLVFVLFLICQTVLESAKSGEIIRGRLKMAWFGLLIMGIASIIVAAPMLWLFITNPEETWGRVGSVAVPLTLGHFMEAVRVFVDGQDPNWRHHLLGQGQFNLLTLIGFGVGLFVAFTQYRQPAHILLLVSLTVMWLPALLSDPAVHTLRLAGILPAYYGLMTVGFNRLATWRGPLTQSTQLALWLIFLLITGRQAHDDYFYRWANRPEVHEAFDGDIVTLAAQLTQQDNVIIPFYLYTQATMRYELAKQFQESVFLPAEVAISLSLQKTTSFIIPVLPENDGAPLVLVWLVKDKAYISALRREMTLKALNLGRATAVTDSRQQVIAHRYDIETAKLLTLFPSALPQRAMSATWRDNLRLTHYDFSIPNTLNLAWQILGHSALKEKLFVQVIDSQNQPINQQELESTNRKLYRWRDDNLILEQYPLPQNLANGLYFVRVGFFDPQTGQRLTAYSPTQQPLGDEVILGPWAIGNIQPQQPLSAKLADSLAFLGYTRNQNDKQLDITLYWQTLQPLGQDYTAFIQLLDAQNQVIAQVDKPPLAGLYPTSRWQVGDILFDKFTLTVPTDINHLRLVTGMYDLTTGARLTATNDLNQPLPENLIDLD